MFKDAMFSAAIINDEAGATAIEYGLIAALTSVASIMAFQMLGLNLTTVFETITSAMKV